MVSISMAANLLRNLHIQNQTALVINNSIPMSSRVCPYKLARRKTLKNILAHHTSQLGRPPFLTERVLVVAQDISTTSTVGEFHIFAGGRGMNLDIALTIIIQK